MDPYQGFTGDEGADHRPPYAPSYHHSLQLHNLLAAAGSVSTNALTAEVLGQHLVGSDGGIPPTTGTQFPTSGTQFPTHASLAGGVQDYISYQQPRKRNRGEDDHFMSSFPLNTARQFPASDPASLFLRPDPPSEDISFKRARTMSGSNHDNLAFAQATGASFNSLPGHTRGSLYLHSFPQSTTSSVDSRFLPQSEGLQHENPYLTTVTTRPPLASVSGLEQIAQLASAHRRANQQLPEAHNLRGGIFDDADSEDESMNVVSSKLSQDFVPRPQDATASNRNMVASGNGGGGIFDDAEEELEFVPPSYASIAPIEPVKPSVPSKLEAKQLQAFKPATQPKAPGPPSSSRATSRAASPAPVDVKSKSDGTKKSSQKKKKAVKPTKRVLFARKETDLAISVLDGKDDLKEILDASYCDFLGKNFWIFTIQQLDFVLLGNDVSPGPANKEDETNSRETREQRRQELVVRLAQSQLVPGSKHETQAATPMETDGSGEKRGEKADPEVDPKAEVAAEKLIRSWQTTIEVWKRRDPAERDIPHGKKFPLDGPIACLFPRNILRFLASVPDVLSLYDFLCLKKTETGAIISYCKAWRKQCGLTDGTPLSLAKQFLGIGLRAETAVTLVPAPDAWTRKWMGDPLVVMTGAAKEYLIDERRISSGKTFIDTRTKDLANGLMEWRAKKGLPPLKGSGKVAMISGWKASVKEAIDLEEGEGKVLRGINFQALIEQNEHTPVVKEEGKKVLPSTKPLTSQKFTYDPSIPDVNAALRSEDFLRQVMDHKHVAVLETVGIKTATELLAASKKQGSPLANAVSKTLSDPSQFELVIFDWCQIVRKKLSGIRRVHSNSKKEEPPSDPPLDKTKAKKKAKPTEAKQDTTPVQRQSKQALLQKDPFYSLSAVTQTFLKTLGIETAEAFMKSRTTDLSSAFVEFRAKNNMSVLKGLGAIASVSGWKAQIRKIAKERGLDDLAAAAPGGPSGSPKAKPKPLTDAGVKPPKVKPAPSTATPPKKSTLSANAGASERRVVLSHPDVLFGRPSKKLVVESARDPRIRYYFEISIRKNPEISLFITYIGARKLTTVNSDYSRIHQRNFSIVDNCNVSDVSLLVAKDLSKKIKKDPNSSSAAGKDIRVPFSSLEDGCGLIELCKHDVWPLACEGEAERIWPSLESFILVEETSEVNYESNVVVGKDENGRSQYFLFLKDPLERGQSVEIKFCSPRVKKRASTTVAIDYQWRKNVEGMLSRLSRRGLRSLLKFVKGVVVDKIDKQIFEISNNGTDQSNVFVSRRRAHWLAFKIISQLQGQETKGAKTKSGGSDLSKEFAESYDKVAWTPQLVAKLKEHPLWTDSTVAAIKNEIENEVEAGIKSNEFLNAGSRARWCTLANDLYESLLPRIKNFSGFLDPNLTQQTIIDEVHDAAFAFAKTLRADTNQSFEKLLMTFEEHTDGLPCASPSLKHVLLTSVEQGYKDALALCGMSPFEVNVPTVQRVIATTASSPSKAGPATEKEAKEAAKKPEEASFRTLEDLKTRRANIHEAWYLRFQLLQVLSSLLSVSSVLLAGGISLKIPTLKFVESSLLKTMGGELTKFDKSTVSVLAGTPVTFPSEVTDSAYHPNPLPLFLGLIWPVLRSLHWKVEAGDTPTDYSFLPAGQRGRRQTADKRTKTQKQERTRSRIKFAKAANELGLGIVPKLTKRLFVNAVVNNADDVKAGKHEAVAPTVSLALERFLTKMKSEMGEGNTDARRRADLVVNYLREAFDALTVLESPATSGIVEGKRPSETLGCEHLARFIFIAPSILCQADLSFQILEDTMLLLKELASFLSLQHTELFAPSFCPPKEVYVGDTTPPSILASRLEKPRSLRDDASKIGDLTEAILPEDRLYVTDFIDVVMSQVVPCRATQEDAAKKNRRISVGFTGLMCRHCVGSKGEGRYFFTSIESMTTAATVVEKHIQKCTMVAPDIKAKMAEARSRHAEQRKHLGQGAQAKFFLNLWERLRASKVRDTAASLQILEENEKQDPYADEAATGGGLEFESHVRLLEFLKKTQPWCERQDLSEGLRRYYEGMELGGRLYKTDEMPGNFNSEWLLSKVLASASSVAQQEPATPKTTTPSKPPAKP